MPARGRADSLRRGSTDFIFIARAASGPAQHDVGIMTFRIGFIGAGSIAEVHADAAVKAGQRIAGFCDVVEAKAQRLAAKYPGAIATISINELLAQPDMPAVVVATPNHQHRDHALAVLAAGKDLLLEKPMAINIAQCDEIV